MADIYRQKSKMQTQTNKRRAADQCVKVYIQLKENNGNLSSFPIFPRLLYYTNRPLVFFLSEGGTTYTFRLMFLPSSPSCCCYFRTGEKKETIFSPFSSVIAFVIELPRSASSIFNSVLLLFLFLFRWVIEMKEKQEGG